MSLATQLSSAATYAQAVLAELGGAAVSAPNGMIGGLEVTGVFGSPQTFDIPTAAGGYRRRAQLTYSVTRGQFPLEPKPKQLLIRTDLAPNVAYLVDDIDVHDPLFYHFILVKNGE
jgi:hypothetical protein